MGGVGKEIGKTVHKGGCQVLVEKQAHPAPELWLLPRGEQQTPLTIGGKRQACADVLTLQLWEIAQNLILAHS